MIYVGDGLKVQVGMTYQRLQFMYETATNPSQNLCCNEHLTPAF